MSKYETMKKPSQKNSNLCDLDSSSSVTKKIDVRIRGDHPHRGRIGWIAITHGYAFTINVFGVGMVKVNFADGTACFAEQRHLDFWEG